MGQGQSIHPAAQGRVFKLQRDVHNHEHLYWSFTTTPGKKLPVEVDLSGMFPAVFDQGKLGSCTANAILAAFQYEAIKQKEPDMGNLSRLYEYYRARENLMPPSTSEDSGTSLAVSVYCLNKFGVCDEKDWPYDVTKFSQEPPKEATEKAKYHKCVDYRRLTPNHDQMRACLAEGYSFVLGIAVFDTMMTLDVGKTGIVPMPRLTEETVDGKKLAADKLLGGHAICCVGYDDKKKLYKFRNSWSEAWGDKGYGYLPYAFVENDNLAYDMWSIRLVKSDQEPADKQ